MFDKPAAPHSSDDTADRFLPREHVGRLVAIRVEDYRPQQKAGNDYKPAVAGAVTVIDGPEAGAAYPDALIFGAVLVPQLKDRVGRHVLGRIIEGERRNGNNAPFILQEATEAETEYAVRFLAGAPAPQPATASAVQPVAVGAASGAPRAPWE